MIGEGEARFLAEAMCLCLIGLGLLVLVWMWTLDWISRHDREVEDDDVCGPG